MENKIKELLKAAGRKHYYTNRSFYCKAANAALATGLVKVEICEEGKMWRNQKNETYNLKVSGGGYVRIAHVRGTIGPGDILHNIGVLLTNENVKAVIKSDVHMRSGHCRKCQGAGIIPQFYYYCSGICFDCGGTGANFSNEKTTVKIENNPPC